MCLEYRNDAIDIYGLQGVTEKFFLSPPDVANGFFLEVLEFWDGGKPFVFFKLWRLHLRVGAPQTQALPIVSLWTVQDAVWDLRFKVSKNFQLTENPEITRAS